MSISISVTAGVSDEGASKFFGSPAVPAGWEETFEEDVIFFCQINLREIAPFDPENRLPHSGYLYLFFDTAETPYRPIVRLFDGQPDTVIDDFNDISEAFSPLTQAYEMHFERGDDRGEGIRLFGEPCGWPYEEAPPALLMQYDPLETDMPFMDEVDGFLYLFYEEDITDAFLQIERS